MAGDLEPSLLEVVQDLYSPIVLHMQLVLGYRKNDEVQTHHWLCSKFLDDLFDRFGLIGPARGLVELDVFLHCPGFGW